MRLRSALQETNFKYHNKFDTIKDKFMNTENIEILLENLISVNEKILDELCEIKSGISEITNELNWVGEHTYAKVVHDELNNISTKLESIDCTLSL